jgi:hypothetical protein
VLTIQTWQNVKALAQKELSRAEQLLYLPFVSVFSLLPDHVVVCDISGSSGHLIDNFAPEAADSDHFQLFAGSKAADGLGGLIRGNAQTHAFFRMSLESQ